MRSKKRKNPFSVRTKLVSLFYLSLLVFFAGRAGYLQLLQGNKYKQKMLSQSRERVRISSKRGVIVDRNGNLMAVSLKVPSVYARPQEIDDPVRAAKKISSILDIPYEDILSKLRMKTPFVWVKRWVTPWEAEQIISSGIKGFYIHYEYKRHYPNKELAAPVLGFVGVDGDGLTGLEKYYDNYLKGENLEVIVEKDGKGNFIYIDPPESGAEIKMVLTIDRDFQYEVEKVLKETIEEYRAKAGMAIFMDPKAGEVLAMASYPSFNPNVFTRYSKDTYRNRTVTDIFEPGSTFKVFTLAAGLEEKIINLSDQIFCENGSMFIDDRKIADYKPFGWLTVKDVIVYSSNIGAAKIGWKVGANILGHYISEFGFGKKTGIDFPGESPGLVKDFLKWVPVELSTISFGQGIGVTAIQMLVGFSSIVNEGYTVRPFLVSSIIKNGVEVYRATPTFLRRVISKETAEKVKRVLVEVVERGTGRAASVNGYFVGGKTGTSQKFDEEEGRYSKNKYISSFLGFAPFRDTKVIGIVVIDEPQGEIYASKIAVPAFGKIISRAMALYQIPYEREIRKAEVPGGE
jgi:cell division protein FtsI (penicillin-binding protein 3)